MATSASEASKSIRLHHKRAFELISSALQLEETGGSKEQAAQLYRDGILELQLGASIDYIASDASTNEEWLKASKIRDKMIENLANAQERLEELEKSMYNSYTTPPKIDSPTVTKENGKKGLLSRLMSNMSNDNGSVDATTSAEKSTGLPVNSYKNLKPSKRNMPAAKLTQSRPINRTSATSSAAVSKTRSAASKAPSKPPSTIKSTASRDVAPSSAANSQSKNIIANLKNVDSAIAQKILNEIVDDKPGVNFNDIAGLELAKQALNEIVILPSLRPELFTGLRAPARGLLLFGPPGNGKTMLAKAVASEAKAKFFNISASSLTSKYVGESEKLVRALFSVARELQPAIIFIDEVDSLLCERKDGENESSRRLKTEFLIAFDGVMASSEERILVMGATNRPQELDDAALRRLVKRVYVPLPSFETRKQLFEKLLAKHSCPLNKRDIGQLARLTEGYSCSDLTALARDAALGPIRELSPTQVQSVAVNQMRNIVLKDFMDSLKRIRKSVPPGSIAQFESWNSEYGVSS
ncbi:Spastin [Trichoplax sp. H2]|nr:Spastin [Trichoplax sp. H2]|eukprot:RDD44344.1 Spastin [Trichoplax sp. H2]